MRVICIGDVMVDVLAQLPGELAIGSDTPAEISLLGGGSAANTAAWLVVAGASATFAGRVGDDALGRKAVDDLSRAGVDLAVTVDPDLPTGTCIVLVDPRGERTMVPSAGANATGGEAPPFAAGDHLHLSGYVLFHDRSAAAAQSALAAARAAGCTVSVDAASSAPLATYGAARFVTATAPALVFANCAEAEVLTGTADPPQAARLLAEQCGEAIVKCGSDGAVWSDGTEVVRAESSPIVTTDSTGAGDAFAAGVLAARLRGADLRDCLAAGNSLAARAIGRRGARP